MEAGARGRVQRSLSAVSPTAGVAWHGLAQLLPALYRVTEDQEPRFPLEPEIASARGSLTSGYQ